MQSQVTIPQASTPPNSATTIAGTSVEGQVAPVSVNGQAAIVETPTEPVVEPQFKYQLPTGSVYKDEQALVQGAIEKDIYIKQLKFENDQLKARGVVGASSQQVSQAPPGPPPQMVQSELNELVTRFPNTERADLQAMAEHNVSRTLSLKKEIMGEFQSSMTAKAWQGQYDQFRSQELPNGVDLDNDPMYDQVWRELPGQSPEAHYAVWKFRKGQNGQMASKVAPPATVAAGQYQRTMNNGAVGTGPATAQGSHGANHPYVQQCVEQALSSGKAPEVVERVRQRAIENIPNIEGMPAWQRR